MTVIFKHEEPQLIPERAGMLANEVENNNDTCKAQGSSKPRVSWMVCGHSWSANGPLWGSLEGTNQWTSPAFFQAKQNVRLMIGTPICEQILCMRTKRVMSTVKHTYII